MKYLRFDDGGGAKWGELRGDEIAVLSGSPLEDGIRTDETRALAKVKILPPVQPPNIVALGKNYAEHALEIGGVVLKEPVVFLKATSAVIAHGEDILLPRTHPDEVDYEAELAVVIGKTGKHIAREKAKEYIFGYTAANDVSARDCQQRIDKQWARGKSFDTFCPLGPWIETEFDPSDVMVRLKLNGQTMQEQSTRDLIFDVPAIVAHVSSFMTLTPGTVILTGTPAGVGMARTPPVFLREGDVTEVEIEGLGVLRNKVCRE